MIRPLLLAILAAALLAPSAAAQAAQPSTLAVALQGADAPVTAAEPLILGGKVEYAVDAATARTHLHGVEVTLGVVEAPAWAVVTVSPSTLILRFDEAPRASAVATAQAAFAVTVSTSREDDAREVGKIVVQARTSGSHLVQQRASHAETAVAYGPADCHHEAPGAEEPTVLETQGARPTPVATASMAAVGGAAVAGAAAALAARRLLRR